MRGGMRSCVLHKVALSVGRHNLWKWGFVWAVGRCGRLLSDVHRLGRRFGKSSPEYDVN